MDSTHREICTKSLRYSWFPVISSRWESNDTSNSVDSCTGYLDLRTKYYNYPISSILISLSNTLWVIGRRLFCWNVDYIYPFSLLSAAVMCRCDTFYFLPSSVVGVAIFGLNCWALSACFIILAEVLFYGDLFMHEGDFGRNDIRI